MAFISAVGIGAPARSILSHPRRHALTTARPVVVRPASAAAVRMDASTTPSASAPKTVGIGIIGCGRIGQVHAKAISSTLGAKLVAVADPFEKFGRAVASEFSTTWVADWKELVANPEVDGVVIGSPTPFHAEQIIACAEAGKAIFCEKPISNDLATIDNCLEAVDKSGVKLLVGFQRRFDSNFQKVKSVVSSGAIGDVRTFTITSRDPAPPPADYLAKSGGIFLDMASHDFDMARFVCGAEIESVFVTGAAIESAAQEAGDLDTVITVLKMSNGAFGTIENSRRCGFGYDQRVEVFGGKGSVIGSNKANDTVTVNTDSGIDSSLPFDFFMDRYAAAYTGIMGAFVDMVAQDGEVPVGGADGRAPIVAAKAAQLSVKEGRLVRLDEVDLVKATAGAL
ncbi:hypothetical protein BU14_1630s0003 [Porphyra umbilicalis]|uniref:Gfo/Idh/MocA-like oxidoreductase N-terminal domain-containing protein n=1 Tax=Porphyra umbilicalis TaxID=2786 RepID=A0A1X6NLA5_PORUM|nr:hypothetical protein BU14_1630s0003 [Porphyra umbilicalis]|eukprot:OSX69310.1 hypothetical protein BU14_1630s0003 [Porphyra umbilicalis]